MEKHAEEKLGQIIELIKSSGEEMDECTELEDCSNDQLTNVARILLNLTKIILESFTGGKNNTLIKDLHHIKIWAVNRLLIGLLGAKHIIIGESLEPTLKQISRALGMTQKNLYHFYKIKQKLFWFN